MQNSRHGFCRTFVLGAFIILAAAAAFAGPGDRVTRNPWAVNTGSSPGFMASIAMRGDGRFVAVWSGDYGVFLRLFSADGVPQGPETLVVERRSSGSDALPVVALAADGSFVVAWNRGVSTTFGAVAARLFDASGTPRGDLFLVSDEATQPNGDLPSVAMARDGRFAIAWDAREPDGGQLSPYVRRFDAAGIAQAPPLRVSGPPSGSAHYVIPKVAMSASGALLVVWVQTTDGSPETMRAKRFGADGLPLGPAFTVANSFFNGRLDRWNFDVDMSDAGEALVSYVRWRLNNANEVIESQIVARRYDAAGVPRGAEFRVSVGAAALAKLYLAADMNAAGDFVVTWVQQITELNGQTLHTRLYRASGIAATNDEGFRFNAFGTWHPSELPQVALDDRGNFVTTMQTYPFYGMPNLWGQRFAGHLDTRPSCARYIATRAGTSNAETIDGTGGDDVIQAFGGNDTVNGGGGSDVICGGGGADLLFGGSGSDEMFGGSGDDVLDGGNGWDLCDGEGQTNADTAVQCESTRNVP